MCLTMVPTVKAISGRTLMTVQETAAYLCLSRHRLYQMLSDATIPFPYFKFARKIVFDRKDVDAWLETRKVPSVSSF